MTMKAYIFTPTGRKLTVLNVFQETTVEQVKFELRRSYGMRPEMYQLLTSTENQILSNDDQLESLMASKYDDFVDMVLIFTHYF